MAATADHATAGRTRKHAAGQEPEDVAAWRSRIEQRLEGLAERYDGACPRLIEAMRYGLLAPGKRVRPLLGVLTALDFDRDAARVIDFGCALEMVHCASLMLDDLPCMDDAQLRRGRPAAHHRFGEATTTLAAIGLLNQAYAVVSCDAGLPYPIRSELVSQLSRAVGTAGLVSGQSRDLQERDGVVDGEALDRINRQKTGVLFELAIAGAGRIVELPDARIERLNRFAGRIGLAFQHADDLLDVQRPARASGKDRGADRGKAGSVHDVGVDELRHRLRCELADADAELAGTERTGMRLQQFVHALFGPLL
jgi:geranylgeranyl diphosphate synthase type II